MSTIDLCPNDPGRIAPAGAAPPVHRRLVAGLAAAWRWWLRERRIARGAACLREMDARGLRDLGVDRGEIDRVVRYGRR